MRMIIYLVYEAMKMFCAAYVLPDTPKMNKIAQSVPIIG